MDGRTELEFIVPAIDRLREVNSYIDVIAHEEGEDDLYVKLDAIRRELEIEVIKEAKEKWPIS